jgi:hypothetical protein
MWRNPFVAIEVKANRIGTIFEAAARQWANHIKATAGNYRSPPGVTRGIVGDA